MEKIVFLIPIILLWIAFEFWNIERKRKEMLKEFEMQFLIMSMSLIQYKYQAMEILKIVYDKAGESDPQFIVDYEKIKKSVDDKFEMFGDEWIINLRSYLNYKTKYKNWKEATKYTEELLKAIKKNEHRKGD